MGGIRSENSFRGSIHGYIDWMRQANLDPFTNMADAVVLAGAQRARGVMERIVERIRRIGTLQVPKVGGLAPGVRGNFLPEFFGAAVAGSPRP